MRILTLMLATAILLSGCSGSTPQVTPNTYTVSMTTAPTVVAAGTATTYGFAATGALERTSDHMGAHYWAETPADPTAMISASTGCNHMAGGGGVPGPIEAVCTFPAGTHVLLGHLRIMEGEDQFDFWSAPISVVALDGDSYTLTVTGAPSQTTTGAGASFEVNVMGPAGVTSDHLGAHYWSEAQADPTGNISASTGCAHSQGAMAGSFGVDCTFQEAGTYHVYGHARVTLGQTKFDYWAPAFVVEVA